MSSNKANAVGSDFFADIENKLVSDTQGDVAGKMIQYLDQERKSLELKKSESGTVEKRAQVTALIDAVDASQEIIKTVWMNFHPGKRLY